MGATPLNVSGFHGERERERETERERESIYTVAPVLSGHFWQNGKLAT